MKKIVMLTAALAAALWFAACDNPAEGGGDNSDVTGTWADDKNTVTLEIGGSNWTFIKSPNSITGRWSRSGNILTFEYKSSSDHYPFASGTLTEGKLVLNVSPSEYKGLYTLSKKGSSTPSSGTPLTVKNESFTEITHVIWQNVSFANNAYENSIKSGTTVTQNVQEGAGYIFFKRKTNPITARTMDIVIVEKGKAAEFIFSDSALIVEAHNAQNTGPLGSLARTVVFFDDAEGEMQPYTEKKSFVGYYGPAGSGLPATFGGYFHAPKNGSKSIAVGYTNTASLHLAITLTKKAKLSFWYANKAHSGNTTFSINNEVKRTWTTDIDWSYVEYTLEAGQTDLLWEKKDGHDRYYLSLDDILIYTE